MWIRFAETNWPNCHPIWCLPLVLPHIENLGTMPVTCCRDSCSSWPSNPSSADTAQKYLLFLTPIEIKKPTITPNTQKLPVKSTNKIFKGINRVKLRIKSPTTVSPTRDTRYLPLRASRCKHDARHDNATMLKSGTAYPTLAPIREVRYVGSTQATGIISSVSSNT